MSDFQRLDSRVESTKETEEWAKVYEERQKSMVS